MHLRRKKNMFGYDWKYRKLIYVINHFLFILMTQRLQWQDFQWIREIICFNYYNKLYDEKLLDLTCQYLAYFCPWKKNKTPYCLPFLITRKTSSEYVNSYFYSGWFVSFFNIIYSNDIHVSPWTSLIVNSFCTAIYHKWSSKKINFCGLFN